MDNQRERVAIVTGGGRGIGEAVALRLAADGFAVAVLDIDSQSATGTVERITLAGGHAIAIGADVSDENGVNAAVERCADELGPPQVLINNAGIIRDNLLFRMSVEEWDRVMSVHLRGAFLMSRVVQRHMTDAGWGRIINISSVSALGNRGQANYAAAKAGLQGFTKTLAIELGRFGITTNCVAPGYIETDMLLETATRMGVAYADFAREMTSDIAVARMGVADDIAAAVSFFARDDAGFVNGQVLYVSGGPAA
ncbi:MAG: 3-oxoacyl-ACP reductase FabG [Galbitalea sp.]